MYVWAWKITVLTMSLLHNNATVTKVTDNRIIAPLRMTAMAQLQAWNVWLSGGRSGLQARLTELSQSFGNNRGPYITVAPCLHIRKAITIVQHKPCNMSPQMGLRVIHHSAVTQSSLQSDFMSCTCAALSPRWFQTNTHVSLCYTTSA